MGRTKPIELTNLCLIYDENKILVHEREWRGEKGIIFPGDHVEDGESILESVVREMKEETGLTIENPIPCGFKDWFNDDGSRYLVLLYKTNRFSGELKSSSEGKVFWVTREQFETLHVIWNMREILQILDSDQYSELYWRQGQQEGELLG